MPRSIVGGVTLVGLRDGFRDEPQRRRAQDVVQDRLADDRDQDECRYLMRFWWQLSMGYQEVTADELREHVRDWKLAAVEALVAAIRSAPEEVDVWIRWAEVTFPRIQDRGVMRAKLAEELPPGTVNPPCQSP